MNSKSLIKLLIIATSGFYLAACNSDSTNDSDPVTADSDSVSNSDTVADSNSTSDSDSSESTLDISLFRGIVSSSTVSCTLDSGLETTCYELVFNVNEVRDGSGNGELIDEEAGPFCPSSYTAEDGGVGIYDGDTNPGFQNLTKTLWDSMEADGYDAIDEVNNLVCIQDPGGNNATIGNNCNSYCLNASADDTLTVTYTIPITPENLNSPAFLGEVEHIGLSLDGVPITGQPPSVIDRGGNIPSLDYCGGHHDPAGYYHWHLVPESADLVHEEQGTDGLANCSAYITQDNTALTGFARDGYPIYAYQDLISDVVSTPSDLDQCNGHTGVTIEFPNGVYHYHASLDAPSLPECITGAAVDARESPRIR